MVTAVNQFHLDFESGSFCGLSEADATEVAPDAVLNNPEDQASGGQTRHWFNGGKRGSPDGLDAWYKDNDALECANDEAGCQNVDSSAGKDQTGADDKTGWDGIDDHQGETSDGCSDWRGCAGWAGHHNWDSCGGHHDWDGGGVRNERHRGGSYHDWDGGGGRNDWDSGSNYHDWDGGSGSNVWDSSSSCHDWGGGSGRNDWDGWNGGVGEGWNDSDSRYGWDHSGRCGWGNSGGGRIWHGGDGRKWHSGGDWSSWDESGRSDWQTSANTSSSTHSFYSTTGTAVASETSDQLAVRSEAGHPVPDQDLAQMHYYLEQARGVSPEAEELMRKQLIDTLCAKAKTLTQSATLACNAQIRQAQEDAKKLQHSIATLPPEMAILQHSRNVILKQPHVNPKFSLTKLTRFHSSATTQVDEHQIENWLTHQLNMCTDVPEVVQKDLIALTTGLTKQILTNTKFICEGGKGTVYKVTYMMKREKGQACMALVVFGASFGVDYDLATTELKEGPDGEYTTAQGEAFEVPASKCGTPSMSGEDIRTFIDYLEGLAAQQIWDQASSAQRESVQDDAQDAALAITSANVGLAQDAARTAQSTLQAAQEQASQFKSDIMALRSTCQAAAAESKSSLEATQERASQVVAEVDELQSTCRSAVQESIETRRKVDTLDSKVGMFGKKEFYVKAKIHIRKKDFEGFVGHVAECGLDCRDCDPLEENQVWALHHKSLRNEGLLCAACFAR